MFQKQYRYQTWSVVLPWTVSGRAHLQQFLSTLHPDLFPGPDWTQLPKLILWILNSPRYMQLQSYCNSLVNLQHIVTSQQSLVVYFLTHTYNYKQNFLVKKNGLRKPDILVPSELSLNLNIKYVTRPGPAPQVRHRSKQTSNLCYQIAHRLFLQHFSNTLFILVTKKGKLPTLFFL